MTGKLMALAVVAVMAWITPAHAMCFDRSVACELHELNDNLERMQDDVQWAQWDAMVDREYAQLQRELDNARTPEDFERAAAHEKQVYDRLNRALSR